MSLNFFSRQENEVTSYRRLDFQRGGKGGDTREQLEETL